ncbi:MAG TPA: hypothetical protein VGK89_13910 [Candidatus Eisenbacteria bacterium]|jgi:hypothetical protein
MLRKLPTILAVFSCLVSGCAWKQWERARSADSIGAYEAFLAKHPNSKFSDEARRKLEVLADERDWKSLPGSADTVDFKRFLERHPGSPHTAELEASITSWRRWSACVAADSFGPCEEFLALYPKSRHAAAARQRSEEIGQWQRARITEDATRVEEFLKWHASSNLAAPARLLLDTLRAREEWNDAVSSGDPTMYESFIERYPGRSEVSLARSAMAAMRHDSAAWLAATKAATPQAYTQFMGTHPESPFTPVARAWLSGFASDRKRIDIVDAIEQGKLEVKIEGSGIRTVDLSVRRLTDYPIRLRIPAGSFFVAQSDAQNMVSRSSLTVWLEDQEWTHVEIPAACANRTRPIPRERDSFTVRRSAHQEELVRVVPLFAKSGASFEVQQAAVWIVTDDADYEALGILVERPYWQIQGGTRVIREADAARAMRLIDQAGLDITRKAIWRDRATILGNLATGPLRDWLRDRAERSAP